MLTYLKYKCFFLHFDFRSDPDFFSAQSDPDPWKNVGSSSLIIMTYFGTTHLRTFPFLKKVSVQTFITEVGANDAKGFLTYRRTQLILEKSSLFKNGFRFLLKKMTDLVVLDSQLIHD